MKRLLGKPAVPPDVLGNRVLVGVSRLHGAGVIVRCDEMKKENKLKKGKKKRLVSSSPPSGRREPHVWLNVLPEQLWFRVRRGRTLWEALQATHVELDGDCGGLGKCGKCKIRVTSALGPPTPEEKALLDPDELGHGIRLACRTKIRKDMIVHLDDPDPDANFHQILKAGLRPILHLDPLIDLRLVTPAPILQDEGMSDLDRIKLVLGPEFNELKASLHCLRTLPDVLQKAHFDGAVVIHENSLLAWREWGKLGRRYGLAFDLGTTTLVGKLISLLDTREVAVISCLNSQFKYGSNVVSRLQFVSDHPDGLQILHDLMIRDLNRLTQQLLKVGKLEPEDILIAVAAGNTTMQHLFLKLPPQGIAKAPFTPVLTDGLVIKAAEIGLNFHPEALMYVMPTRSGYIGGDMIAVILASEAAEQDKMVLGLDLGTNGEIYLGNSKKIMTCSAAAGPALEGARISHGMIAKTGAIEGVRIANDRIFYRVIGNTKPRGLCGSGLVDLVAVLLHCGVIDHEGLIRPCEEEDVLEDLRSRVIKKGDLYDFLVASPEESYHGKPVYLTQKDVRELQLAKGAIAAGVQTLLNEMGMGVSDIDEIHLAGALGNYVHPYSAMRIGLLPMVDPGIIKSLGNGALTGAMMVLLSKSHWPKANNVARFIDHVELSTRRDFNESFVEQLDFPDENIW